MKNCSFRFGEWDVSPANNAISWGETRRQMEPRAMDVLVALCDNANTVVSAEQLLERCWGSILHGDNPVHKTITQLRRVLGDNAAAPTYIQTIRKRGYRTLAPVVPAEAEAEPEANWLDVSPFRGLQAFGEQHAAVFFGRRDATLRLRLAIEAQVASAYALQLLLGPSGSGKTSLVRAGLLPQLMRCADGAAQPMVCCAVTFDLGDMTGTDLLTALASALLDWDIDGASLFPGASAHALGLRLALDSGAVMAALAASGTMRCALFVDRLETLFVLPAIDAATRQIFLSILATLARSERVILIAACRNDFYPHIAACPLLMEGKGRGAHFDLAAPSPTEIAQIIRWPARAAGLRFGAVPGTDRDLGDLLCESAIGSPDALPLLQYTLQELYRLRSADGELGYASFVQLGGIEGAIGQRAEAVVGALSDAQRACLPQVLSLIVTVGEQEDSITSQRAPWSALASDEARAVVSALVEARLLVSELVRAEAGFGVAHEAIMRNWLRVVEWIAAHRDALRVRARCATLSQRWLADGRPDDLLLPHGKQLDEAQDLLNQPALALADGERSLILASLRNASWRRRVRGAAIGAIIVLAVLATLLGISAMMEQRVAQQRRAEAEGLMEFMLGDFADKLRPLGRLDLLDSVSAKALGYLSNPARDDAAGLTRRARALQHLAEVQIARGAPQAAETALQAARTILLEQLAAAPSERNVLMNLGANSFWLGQIRLDQSDWGATGQFFQQYLAYSDRVHALEPDAVDAWIEQSYAHNSLGTLELRRGNARAAASEFGISIDLKLRAIAKSPENPGLAAELADSIAWAATADEASGQLAAAAAMYERQLKMLTEVVRAHPADALWKYRLAAAWHSAARLALAQGQGKGALQALEQSGQLYAATVAQDAGNQVWKANTLFVELDTVRLQRPDAVADLQALVARTEALRQHDPKQHEWGRLHALAQRYLAGAHVRHQQPDLAYVAIEAATRRLGELNSLNGADLYTREALADALVEQAALEQRLGKGDAARASCGKARAVLGADAASSADFRVLDPWVRASLCLGLDQDAASPRARLEQMGYRAADYLHFIASH